jgi:hypothetical protein
VSNHEKKSKYLKTLMILFLIANGKHRRKTIFQLEQDEGTVVGEKT